MIYGISSRDKRKELNPGFWKDFAGRDSLRGSHDYANSEPAINIIENKVDYILEVATPGMCKKDFEIEIDNNILKISGDKKMQDEKNYARQDFQFSRFEKTFSLPDSVKHDEISASCNDGILTIEIPTIKNNKDSNHRNIEVM